MNNRRAQQLLDKLREGTISETERLILYAWYNKLYQTTTPMVDAEKFDKVIKAMDAAFPFEITKPRRHILLYRWLGAAAVLFILFLCSLLLSQLLENGSESKNHFAYTNDSPPGKNEATLTLADGRKISLSDSKSSQIIQEQGVTITKTTKGQLVYKISGLDKKLKKFNTLTTANGQQFELILPDHTKVWLNAGSSITYPQSFDGLVERRVELSGEAYFEVAKIDFPIKMKENGTLINKGRLPFVVLTAKQRISVLGTHFNVNAYHDESFDKTTLLEGSVRVSRISVVKDRSNSTAQILLRPDQEAIISTQGMKVNPTNAEDAIAWKNNSFIFKDDSLASTMRKISRWYNVEVVYDETAPKDFVPGGTVSRKKNLSSVLDIMSSTGMIHFKIEGRRVRVMR